MKWKKCGNKSQQQESFASILQLFRSEFYLKDLFSDMIKFNIIRCKIIDYSSAFLSEHYFIDVLYNKKDNNFQLYFFDLMERDYYQQKKRTVHLMNQLFRSFSHEFSTSLNCIQLSADTAFEENSKNQYLVPIIRSCQLLSSILQDVKDFSLILQKNLVISIDCISLNQIIESVYLLFEMQMNMKNLRFKREIDEDIIYSDGNKVKQILINLISNAQKYTQTGFIEIGTCTEIIGLDRFTKVWVRDSGPGLEEEERHRLSSMFKNQMGLRKEKQKSFGIGLMISNQLALKLSSLRREEGGGIQFESRGQNSGSTFWFLLCDFNMDARSIKTKKMIKGAKIEVSNASFKSPRSKKSMMSSQRHFHFYPKNNQNEDEKKSENFSYNSQDMDEIVEDRFQQPYFTREIKLNRPKCECKSVMIVDDEFFNITSLSLIIKRMGLECDYATNGEQGYEKVIHKYKNRCSVCLDGYKLVFMDIEMPIMNGIKAAEKIRDYCLLNNEIKPVVIAQTAYVDCETKEKCAQAGMEHFLSKPIQKLDLYEIISLYYC